MSKTRGILVSAACLAIHLTCVEAFNAGFSTRSSVKRASLPSPLKVATVPDVGLREDVWQEVEEVKQTSTASQNSWIENLDYEAFSKDVSYLGKQLQKETGDADVEHLNKILSWRNLAAVIGVSTMGLSPNPITIAALSTWIYSSWTMVAHHTCHGGYNRVDAGKYNSRGFALGSVHKRISDWCDWMLPEAWNIEHNRLHHYHLSESLDPDLVERNTKFIREMNAPMAVKYAIVGFFMTTWKWFYYAPNTFKELKIAQYKSEKKQFPENIDIAKPLTLSTIFKPKDEAEENMLKLVDPTEFLAKVLAPFFVSRFILLPAPLLLVPGMGSTLFAHAVINILLAEILTNIHSFITIVTNHAGEDLYTFDDEVKAKSGAFYVRQVISSANYATGSDANDFAHGWLNYQIEHHVWPDLSMLQYQRGAPRLKAICEKHGVPYVQESVWTRLRKTVDIMVGKTSMMKFPTELEPAKDKAGKGGVTWKSTNGAIDEE